MRCELTQTHPPRSALEDVGQDAFFVHYHGVDLVVERIGSVGNGNIAQHAHGDELMGGVEGIVLAGDGLSHLLITGGNVAGWRKHRRTGAERVKAVLVAAVHGVCPGVLNLLELGDLRAFSGSDSGLDGRSSRIG